MSGTATTTVDQAILCPVCRNQPFAPLESFGRSRASSESLAPSLNKTGARGESATVEPIHREPMRGLKTKYAWSVAAQPMGVDQRIFVKIHFYGYAMVGKQY
jgi:hypothetical protein